MIWYLDYNAHGNIEYAHLVEMGEGARVHRLEGSAMTVMLAIKQLVGDGEVHLDVSDSGLEVAQALESIGVTVYRLRPATADALANA